MAGLNLPAPMQLDVAVPANLFDGNHVTENGKPSDGAVLPAPYSAD